MAITSMHIKKFSEISKNDTHIAGGKGASLGEMTQASLPVPPGFVVLAQAFDRFLEETDLNVEVDAILHTVSTKEIHTCESAAEKIEALILSAEMPADLRIEIGAAFGDLGAEYVAVRSSATAEDSSAAAWAGQLESYLNTTEENLIENVKKCWASLFTPRAIFYRFEKELHEQKISVAVVVQKMVESEMSGIAFSVHPVTQDRNQLIIEAGYGLGEAIVSGQVTPNSYVVEKSPQRILDKNISNQGRGMYRVAGGGNEWKMVSDEQGGRQVLSDDQIIELSNIIMRIEGHYQFPCDIEWAFEGGKFYIVQSRPITTLAEEGGQPHKSGAERLVEKFFEALGEDKVFPFRGPFSPLLCGGIRWNYPADPMKGCETPIVGINKDRDTLAGVSEDKYFGSAKKVFDEYSKGAVTLEQLGKTYGEATAQIESLYNDLASRDVHDVAESELIAFVEKAVNLFSTLLARTVYIETFDRNVITDILGKDAEKIVDGVWEKATHPYFESFANRNLRNRIAIIKEHGVTDKAANLARFIYTDYIFTKSNEEILRELAEIHAAIDEKDQEINATLVAVEAGMAEYRAWLETLSNEERKIVEYTQFVMRLRDVRKDPVAQAQAIISQVSAEMFRRAGIDVSHAYSVLSGELSNGIAWLIENKERIMDRKNGVVFYVSPDGTYAAENANFEEMVSYAENIFASDNEEGILKGQTACPGVVTGTVKIVLDVHSEHAFEEGDILVTSMTRPEFVPIMKKAAAIITNEGGITCHAAIVSRELNIPCVIGTKVATHVLKDGDKVEMDAGKGIIKIIK